jgi:hypothetical protein
MNFSDGIDGRVYIRYSVVCNWMPAVADRPTAWVRNAWRDAW